MKWQTRTLATFIAATVPVEKAGDVNPLLDVAKELGLDEHERQHAAELKERESQAKKVDPPAGSFENFMSTFGNPGRWAGR